MRAGNFTITPPCPSAEFVAAKVRSRNLMKTGKHSCAQSAGPASQFLGAEKPATFHFAVNPPPVDFPLRSSVGHRNRFQVMMLSEIGVGVGRPVDHIHKEIQIMMLFLGDIYDQEVPTHRAALDH